EVTTFADLPPIESRSKVWKIGLHHSRIRVYDDDLYRLMSVPELESLDLDRAGRIGPIGVEMLARHKHLKSLGLSGATIRNEGLQHLQGLTNLEHLSLADAWITDAGLTRLANMKNLTTLDIGGNDISDAGAATLAGFLKLKSLDLTHTGLTDQGLERLL